MFHNIIKIRIKGKNIYRYLGRIIKNKVKIIKLDYVNRSCIYLTLEYSEYLKLLEIKSIYEISIVEYKGINIIKKKFERNIFLVLFMLLGLIFIIILSRFIFSIDIVNENREIRELIRRELREYDIDVFRLKKRYGDLELIEDKILDNNKDKLEWIEIIESGTKYTVRVQTRKINSSSDSLGNYDVISKKNAVIKMIDAYSGEKMFDSNSYVSKGSVVISGRIYRPDGSYYVSSAKGNVYGEVWYRVGIDYPFVYRSSDLTGRRKSIYQFNFMGREINSNKGYRYFESKDKVIFRDIFSLFSLVKRDIYEVKVIDNVNTIDTNKRYALDYVMDKLRNYNSDIMDINKVITLEEKVCEKYISYIFFISVLEDIGEYREIVE